MCTSTKALKGYSQQVLLKYKQISLTVYFEERSRSGSSASSSVFLEKDKLLEHLMLIYQQELHGHPMTSWQENQDRTRMKYWKNSIIIMDGSVYHFCLPTSFKCTYTCCKNVLCFVLDLAEKVVRLMISCLICAIQIYVNCDTDLNSF